MRWKNALWAASVLAGSLLVPSSLRAQGSYLDVYIAKAKPEKAVEMEALAKKIADINRNNNGDRVIAMETVYGDGYTYVFVTQRQDYADIDKGGEAFMNALNKGLGKPAALKLLADWNNCLLSSHSEIRVRRPDLSSKMPKDPQSFAKLVGESRIIRTLAIHIRPGHNAEFEAEVKEINTRADRMPNTQPVLISQVIEGGRGNTYYIAFFRKSLGGFDKDVMLEDILGEEGMAKLAKSAAETEQGSESTIYRFRPDMSYPPQEVSDVASDFWRPKPDMATTQAKPKTATSAGAASNAKPESKPQQ
jgi:hypothetical protein